MVTDLGKSSKKIPGKRQKEYNGTSLDTDGENTNKSLKNYYKCLCNIGSINQRGGEIPNRLDVDDPVDVSPDLGNVIVKSTASLSRRTSCLCNLPRRIHHGYGGTTQGIATITWLIIGLNTLNKASGE